VELIERAADDSHVQQVAQHKRESKGDPHLDDEYSLEYELEMSDPESVEQACGEDVVVGGNPAYLLDERTLNAVA